MTKFKVGDKIRIKNEPYHKREVLWVSGDGILLKVKDLTGGRIFDHSVVASQYELEPDTTSEAISLLTSLGYDITPPKPKLTGEIVVYRYNLDNIVRHVTRENWNNNFTKSDKDKRPILAILPWTEGDGVTNTNKE